VAEHRENCRAFVNKGCVKYGKFDDWLGNLSFRVGFLYRYMDLVISGKYFDLSYRAAGDVKRMVYVFFFPFNTNFNLLVE